MLTPLFRLSDLKAKHIYAFRYKIPPIVKLTDSIKIYDIKKEIVITGFHKESIVINGNKMKKCLAFKIINYYPDTTSAAYVWLDKRFGLVRWIRTTGRLDTRVL